MGSPRGSFRLEIYSEPDVEWNSRVLFLCYAHDQFMQQGYAVMLVIRTPDGEVRWMEVRDWLKRESDNGKKPVKQIVFEGERFDVMSLRRWRERVLSGAGA